MCERDSIYVPISLAATLKKMEESKQKQECEQCKKLEDRFEMTKEKMRDVEECLQYQNELRIQLETELDDLRTVYEMKDDECQKLQQQLDTYLKDPEVAPKLPTYANNRINELCINFTTLKNENYHIYNEFIKQQSMCQFEVERCKTLSSEMEYIKTRAEEQHEAHESLKKHFIQRLEELNSTENEKSEQIKELENTVMLSIQLFSKLINSPEFTNEELKQEIQDFLDVQCNANENL
uniref:Uncharacterized protein n=1 Tax=Panagrolaimus superbus TaxID=310955 RepID=A0A914YT32_9BILA